MNSKQNYENLQHSFYLGTGEYDIPQLKGTEMKTFPEFIGFNYAKSEKNKQEKGVHFFLDDYQFLRVWNNPTAYLNMLRKFGCVLSPDFSLYRDYPKAIQIYNHYRKHWLGAFWEENGIKVIPTISWGDEESFEWCFQGEPTNKTVAVSSVGTQNNKDAKDVFILGYEAMLDKLKPKNILFYGNVPKECKGDIINIKSFQSKWKGANANGR